MTVPIYEYQCETCEHKFEVQQKFSDPLVDACTKCGKSESMRGYPGHLRSGTASSLIPIKVPEPLIRGQRMFAQNVFDPRGVLLGYILDLGMEQRVFTPDPHFPCGIIAIWP